MQIPVRPPRSPAQRIAIAIAGITLLTALGTLGYVVIEKMSFLDALYMTVITISTVGYGEVKPLDDHGRIFTMMLIILGVGTAFYLFATMTEVIIEGQLRDYLGAKASEGLGAPWQRNSRVTRCPW